MRRMVHTALMAAALLTGTIAVDAEVVTYAAPAETKTSTDFTVSVNGQSLPVYKDVRYYFVVFSMSGTVTMNVAWTLPFTTAIIRPLSLGLVPTVNSKSATFSFTGPRNISFESNDPYTDPQKVPALFIFANPLEVNIPSAGDPGIEYYGPGFHDIGAYSVTAAKKTIYLAGGAYLKGKIKVDGVNDVLIYGRGILNTTYLGVGGETTEYSSIFVNNCTGFRLQGITVTHNDTWSWTTTFRGSSRAVVDNYHVVAYYINDDGFQPRADWCTFNNIFSATNDDCYSYSGGEHQTYLNCIARGGRARLFQIWKNAYFGFYKGCEAIGPQTSVGDCSSILFEGGATDTSFRFENISIEPKNYAIVLQGKNHYFKNVTVVPTDNVFIGNVESVNTTFENLVVGGRVALNAQDAHLNNIGTAPRFMAYDPGLPEVRITSPTRSDSCDVVTGPSFALGFTIANWPMTPGGKGFRYYVNNVDKGLVHSTDPITVSGLPIGPNSVNIKLVDESGGFTGVQDAIVVTVAGSPSAGRQTPGHSVRPGPSTGPARLLSLDGRIVPEYLDSGWLPRNAGAVRGILVLQQSGSRNPQPVLSAVAR